MSSNYIIRFPDETERDEFCRQLEGSGLLNPQQVECGKILPDVILRDVPANIAKDLRKMAGSEARFLEDIVHQLFVHKQQPCYRRSKQRDAT